MKFLEKPPGALCRDRFKCLLDQLRSAMPEGSVQCRAHGIPFVSIDHVVWGYEHCGQFCVVASEVKPLTPDTKRYVFMGEYNLALARATRG